MVGGVKSHLESNITPTRDAQRAQTKPCRHQDPEAPETEPDLPLSVWVSPALAQVSSVLPWGQGLWLQQTWEARCVVFVLLEDVTISPTIEPPSTQPTDWSTIIPRSSRNVLKFLGPTTDFPTRGSSKRTENPQGIWPWRPLGFDYRTSTGLGHGLLEGTNKTLWETGPRGKEQWPHKRLSQTCLWVSRNLWQRRGLTVACHRVRSTDYNGAGISPFEGGCH